LTTARRIDFIIDYLDFLLSRLSCHFVYKDLHSVSYSAVAYTVDLVDLRVYSVWP